MEGLGEKKEGAGLMVAVVVVPRTKLHEEGKGGLKVQGSLSYKYIF